MDCAWLQRGSPKYRQSADLYGREPWKAIAEDALRCARQQKPAVPLMDSAMDEELDMLYALQQKIENGKADWVEEISVHHGVPAPTDLSDVYTLRVHADGPGAELAMSECTEVLAAVDLVHRNIHNTLGIPLRGSLSIRRSADLWGREPLVAITDSSLHFIDVALIGPKNCAAALLASDKQLMASSQTRFLYSTADDAWAKRIREVIARARSINAKCAIEGVGVPSRCDQGTYRSLEQPP